MNVAMPPVEGSGQDGVESQGAWPELCQAMELFSAGLLSTELGIMIAGMVVFQAKKKVMLSQQLPYKIAMLEDSKDSPAALKASCHLFHRGPSQCLSECLHFSKVCLFWIGGAVCLFVSESSALPATKPEFIGQLTWNS